MENKEWARWRKMNKIIEVAKNAQKIMAELPPPFCDCGEQLFSPFDKLYMATYGKCVSCSNSDELGKNSENIFAIIES